MSAEWFEDRRFRFDGAHPRPSLSAERGTHPDFGAPQINRLLTSISRTRDWLVEHQHPEGYWCGELEGDTILESEYILLLAFLGQGQSLTAKRCANYIRQRQLPSGGWAIYPGGPLEISASVKSYLALKITGSDPNSPEMRAACEAIQAAGGAERVNSFTRYYLALLGLLSYDQVPAVPPEIILLPSWLPFNIYEMSAWSRTILIPMSLLWAFKPKCSLPPEHQIRELFLQPPEQLPVTMPKSEVVDGLRNKGWVDWHMVFAGVDRVLKLGEKLHLHPFRAWAIRQATQWMEDRFKMSDGLGAIFPPIIWSIIALKCLGYKDDSPEITRQMQELDKLSIREGETIRLEPCKSPVWDTAIASLALREAGLASDDQPIRGAVEWLLSKESRHLGDWALRRKGAEPAGWYFEFNNEFYPDVDDTAMVLIALTRCLPWQADCQVRGEMISGDPSGISSNQGMGLVLSWQDGLTEQSLAAMDTLQPMLQSIGRGARWVAGMQNSDGGWGAFDRDNTREIYTQVPFADHNAMIDPSSADLAGRMLEMYAGLGMTPAHPVAQRALEYIWKEQESDHCWFGRWGVNYIYGTWQVLVGLRAIGIPVDDPRMRKATQWLKDTQQACGGWGETPASYDDPTLRGTGTPTASQTAWAILGLIAGGEADAPEVDSGIQYLLDTQRQDGTWDEEPYTGTGFPRVFYLKYHMYRIYFPLMALARAARVRYGDWVLDYGKQLVEE